MVDDRPPPWWGWREPSRAERCVRFAETYCRTAKGHTAGQTLRLTDDQREWFNEILSGEYTAALKSCPRGEGKSTELAALGLWNVFDRPEFGDPYVPVIATRVSQAEGALYDVAIRMVEQEPELANRALLYTGIGAKRLDVPCTHGRIFPKANHVAGLQGLDYTIAIVDEIGFQPNDVWQAVVLAQGKRPWSLAVGSGTPGFDRSADNALWYQRSRYYDPDPEFPVEGLHYVEVSAPPNCEITDDVIVAANPAITAGYKSLRALKNNRTQMTETAFRTYHLGQWVEGAECWLGDGAADHWRSLVDHYELKPRPVEGKRGVPTFVGVDIGIKNDSTAVVWTQHRPDGRMHFRCRIWRAQRNQVINLNAVIDFIRSLHVTYDVREVVYDPMYFRIEAERLANEGLPMVEMSQVPSRTAPAFADLLRDILGGKISHEDDPEFEEHVLNGRAKHTQTGFTLYKRDQRHKIDACYALMMAYDRGRNPPKERPALVIAR